jgi:hypothetical protein
MDHEGIDECGGDRHQHRVQEAREEHGQPTVVRDADPVLENHPQQIGRQHCRRPAEPVYRVVVTAYPRDTE